MPFWTPALNGHTCLGHHLNGSANTLPGDRCSRQLEDTREIVMGLSSVSPPKSFVSFSSPQPNRSHKLVGGGIKLGLPIEALE